MLNDINWDCLNDDVPEPKLKVSTAVPKVTTPLPTLKSPSVIENISNVKQLDIEEARTLLPWEKIEEFKKKASGFEVVTIEECEQALAMSLQSRKLSKSIEKKRKEITKPALELQRGIKAISDSFISELKNIESSLAEKVEAFNTSREKKSEEIGVDLSLVTNSSEGLSYTQSYWEFSVEDIEKVPIEFLEINNKAIKQALSDGERKISGLKIFKVEKTRYRIK